MAGLIETTETPPAAPERAPSGWSIMRRRLNIDILKVGFSEDHAVGDTVERHSSRKTDLA